MANVAGGARWRGDEFNRHTRKQLQAGLKAAGAELHRIARQKASIQNTPEVVAVQRVREGGNATSRTIYPHPSKPGESPRSRTGAGQRGIVGGLRGLIYRIGYTRQVRYMAFHELGIRYRKSGTQKRPTLIPALRDNLLRLGKLFERGTQTVKDK